LQVGLEGAYAIYVLRAVRREQVRRIVHRDPTPEDWQKALDNEPLLNKYIAKLRGALRDPQMLSFNELKSFGWEGMLKAVQNWDPQRGRFSTLAWFCVKNAIAQQVREELAQRGHLPKKGTWANAADVFISVELEDANSETEPEFESGVDEYADLYSAIDQLDEFERDIVVLHYFGTRDHPAGCSAREIGKLLGCSNQWVSTVLRKAVKKLRGQLAPEGSAA